MNESHKNENCDNCDKARQDKSFEDKNTCTTMSSNEDNNGMDHRIVLFGWRLRLATGKKIH